LCRESAAIATSACRFATMPARHMSVTSPFPTPDI